MTLPHTLTNGTTASATQVQANFDALEARLGNLKNTDLAAAAGIEASKLAAPYTIQTVVLRLVDTSGTMLGTSTLTVAGGCYEINQTAMTSLGSKFRLDLRTGQQAWLCAAEWYVGRSDDTGSGGEPKLDLLVDGVQLGGQEITADTSDAYYTIAAANPIDSPLMPVTNQSVFDPRIGCTAAAGAGGPVIAEVTLKLTLKVGPVP